MDGQVTSGALVCAIPKAIVGDWLLIRFMELRRQLSEPTTFLQPGVGLRMLSTLSTAWK